MLLKIFPFIQTDAEVSSQEDSIPRMKMSSLRLVMLWLLVSAMLAIAIFYFDLMATTGSILAAIIAGMIPAATPIVTHIPIASAKILNET